METSTNGAAPCAICAMVHAEPDDGWAYADDDWVAGTLAGLEVPGWIVLALRRHAVETSALTEREAASLGAAIRLLTRAIEEATGAERVYLQAYGEREPHWHMLLSARTAEIPVEHRHVAFFSNREKYIDGDDAVAVVDRIRLNLQGASGAPTV